MGTKIKDLQEVYEKFKHKYFTPEIESKFDTLGKYYGTYDFIKPYNKPIKIEDIEFYILEKHLDNFRNLFKKNQLINENNRAYNKETIIPLLKEYGKGFHKGYSELNVDIKPHTPDNIERNRRIVSYIYSLIDKKENRGAIRVVFIHDQKINKTLKEIYYNLQFFKTDKNMVFESGIEGGTFYKAWEIILENRPLFNEIFKKKSEQNRNFYSAKTEHKKELNRPKIEEKSTSIIETPDLNLSNLPKFTLQQRYSIFELLEFDNAIHRIDTTKQTSKHKILALIMGISLDNAKHLLNGTYKRKLTTDQQEEIQEYLFNNKINL